MVGESGCGKSVTALSLLRLLDGPAAQIDSGRVYVSGTEMLQMPMSDFRKYRGREIAMIFQEPMTALNPVLTIGTQLSEVYKIHRGATRGEAWTASREMLARVKIPNPDQCLSDYPHQLSGGMRQRVVIAMALACNPKVLIADEPTTALDVTIQAQILELIRELTQTTQTGVLFITHDFGVIAEIADDVCVMYAGSIVERGSVEEIFDRPRHHYTVSLMKARPSSQVESKSQLYTIPGRVPALGEVRKGCAFYERCPARKERCALETPALVDYGTTHSAACHFPNTKELR